MKKIDQEAAKSPNRCNCGRVVYGAWKGCESGLFWKKGE